MCVCAVCLLCVCAMCAVCVHVIRYSINLQVCCCGCPHKEVYEQHLQGKKHLRVSPCTHDRQSVASLTNFSISSTEHLTVR